MVRRFVAALTVSLAVAAMLALPSRAATPDQPILPLKFGAWTLQQHQEMANTDLAAGLGQNFAVLVESGLTSAERGAYVSASGGAGVAEMRATLYRLRDSSGAYGAYTFLRTPDMDSSDLTEKSAIGRDRILAVVGNLVLDLSRPGAASLAELKALVLLLGEQTPPGIYPTLWQYLPGAGFERKSDRYLLGPAGLAHAFPLAEGDWLGFGQGAEGEVARYHHGADTLTLLLARYPTPQGAREKLRELETRFPVTTVDAESAQPSAQSSAPASAPGHDAAAAHPLYAERRGLMLMLVSGAPDARAARALLSNVNYATDVTWNEPSWTAKEPPFLAVIASILMATLVLLLYTLVAGLAFAGIRLLVKIWKPGRIFDRDQDMEVIQLGLGSKPIEAKDFLTLGTRK